MGWMSKLISLHNKKEKCLICEKPVGDNAAIVEYSYADGIGKAFICETCSNEMNETRLEDEDGSL